jgi:hypothetical protein
VAKDLTLRVYMNTEMEAVLNFKTACCLKLFDQNLEIHVHNHSGEPVVIKSLVDLEGEQGVIHRIDNLFPPGNPRIGPGELLAFYGQLDDDVWSAARRLVLYDSEGNRYCYNVQE